MGTMLRNAGFVMTLAAGLLVLSCERPAFIEQIKDLAELGEGAEPLSEQEIAKEIARYQKVVNEKVAAAQQLGYYHKLLGLSYFQKGMYARAIDEFRLALSDSPRSPGLYFQIGAASAFIAKGATGPEAGWEAGREEALAAAERNFRKALEIEPNYGNALYSLAVLLVFDLDRPSEAAALLDRYLQKSLDAVQRTNAQMVLARVRYVAGEYEAAMALYDDIISRADSPEETRAQAVANLEQVRAALAGGGSGGD